MIIRYAKESDLKSIAQAEKVSYPMAEGASEESIRLRFNAFPGRFWVIEDNGRLAGFINGMASDEKNLADEMYDEPGMHSESGEWQMIFSVVTVPEYRCRGCASKLMNRVISDVREQGKRGIVLTCKEGLIPFYSRFGFKNEGISQSVHGGAVWYQMRLEF